jgi:hypothetical protein
MKVKTTIRYLGFRPSTDGGRIFEFSVTENERPDRAVSIEIPLTFFEGQNRLHLQEGVGISYAKLKRVLEIAESSDAPRKICLNAADLALHREVTPVVTRRRHGSLTGVTR